MGGETHRAETRLEKGDTALAQKTITQASSSSPIWERLDAFVREQVQRFIQALLEEEISERLGRPTSARRGAVDAPPAESDEGHDDGASAAGAGAA